MEYLEGGELTDYVKAKGGKLSEEEAQFFFR
jgi:serine/threonine protein kinase